MKIVTMMRCITCACVNKYTYNCISLIIFNNPKYIILRVFFFKAYYFKSYIMNHTIICIYCTLITIDKEKPKIILFYQFYNESYDNIYILHTYNNCHLKLIGNYNLE